MDDFGNENFEIVEKTYDVIAHEFDPLLIPKKVNKEEIDAVNDFLTRLVDKFKIGEKTPKIADLGCGLGKHGRYCVAFGFDVTGYDISQEMITLASKLNDQKFAREFYRDDNLHMPQMRFLYKANIYDFRPDEKYDGIISCYTFIHLTRKQAARTMENLKHSLNNGALLFITVYKGHGDRLIEEAFAPGYYMYYWDYQEDELSNLVSEAGYEVLKVTPFKDSDPNTQANPNEGLIAIGLLAVYNGG